MKINMKYITGTLLLLLIFTPFMMSENSAPAERAEKFSEIITLIETSCVHEPEVRGLVYGAISGALETLDPHSNFLPPDVFKEMREKQQGSFYGLGIVISRRDGKLTVISPIEGTPAHRLGIRAGDIISEIEGEPTGDMTTDEAVNLLRGPRGTKVNIKIIRPGLKEPIDFTVTRAEVPTESIPYSFMMKDDVGYIRLRDFTNTTTVELEEHLAELKEAGMKRVMLDLRDNPGGLLDQAVSVSDDLLDKGEMIVFTKGRIRGSSEEFYAQRKQLIPNIPLIVLVNTSSASASEIVAGAVQDHDRGLIAGETTWGKGLVQSIYTLKSEAGLALTTAKYYTPSGRCIQRDYTGGFDEYYLDWHNGGNGKEEEKKGPEMYTEHGRPVYGKGGITPDVIIEPEKIDSPYLVAARRKSAFFTFAVEYLNTHSDAGPDMAVDSGIMEDFKVFLREKNIEYEEDDFKKHLDLTKAFIREEIISAAMGLEEGYRIAVERDKQIQEALKLFPRAEELLRLYGS